MHWTDSYTTTHSAIIVIDRICLIINFVSIIYECLVSLFVYVLCVLLDSIQWILPPFMPTKQIQTELKETEIERDRETEGYWWTDRVSVFSLSVSMCVSLCMLNSGGWQLQWRVIMIAEHWAPWKTKDFTLAYLSQYILLKRIWKLSLGLSLPFLSTISLDSFTFVFFFHFPFKNCLCFLNSTKRYYHWISTTDTRPIRLTFERSLFTAVLFELSTTLFPKTND